MLDFCAPAFCVFLAAILRTIEHIHFGMHPFQFSQVNREFKIHYAITISEFLMLSV